MKNVEQNKNLTLTWQRELKRNYKKFKNYLKRVGFRIFLFVAQEDIFRCQIELDSTDKSLLDQSKVEVISPYRAFSISSFASCNTVP